LLKTKQALKSATQADPKPLGTVYNFSGRSQKSIFHKRTNCKQGENKSLHPLVYLYNMLISNWKTGLAGVASIKD